MKSRRVQKAKNFIRCIPNMLKQLIKGNKCIWCKKLQLNGSRRCWSCMQLECAIEGDSHMEFFVQTETLVGLRKMVVLVKKYETSLQKIGASQRLPKEVMSEIMNHTIWESFRD